MALYVEGSSLIKQRTGVGQFTKRLIEAYSQKYPEARVCIFGFKFFTQGPPDFALTTTKTLGYKINRLLPGRVYSQLFKYGLAPPIDVLVRARPTDTFLFPNFVAFPTLYNNRSLLMVHDLSYIHFAQFAHPKDLPYKLRHVPSSIKKARRIITISENSKREIMEYYGTPEEKISIVYPAVDTNFFHRTTAKSTDQMRTKYRLPRNYILYTGTIEPRKNIDGLLKAYAGLDQKLRSQYGLVLAGGKGWQDDGVLDRISKLQKSGLRIVQTGYVPDEDLPAIYSGASLFVWPSFYEGFGIPPLEAMACGVPVISSNNSSLPEAIGKAGILINPSKPTELVDAITRMLREKSTREKYIAAGYEQVRKFTWDKAARQLQDAIDLL